MECRKAILSAVIALVTLAAASTVHAVPTTILGPLGGTGLSGEYASFADSPFAPIFTPLPSPPGYFHFENFEGGALSTPGVSAPAANVITGFAAVDSVDLDDGFLDGTNTGFVGHSYFTGNGAGGILFTFNAGVLGSLPTHAGIVWTDGAGSITFQAFGPGNIFLGGVLGNHAGAGFGTTGEDRFYGVIDPMGIESIFISNSSGGIEVDHLQYGLLGPSIMVPEASTFLLMGTGLIGMIGFGWRKRKQDSVSNVS